MGFAFTVYSLPALAGALSAAAMALYGWTRRNRVGRLFALFAVCAAIWGLTYTLELNSAGLAAKLLWAKLAYAGIALAPVAWMAFALQFTGRDRLLNRRALLVLLIIPLITLALVVSNEAHHLIWAEAGLDTSGPFTALAVAHGLWFWVFAIYSYGLNFVGIVLVLLTMVRAPAVYQGQVAMLLLGVALPWLANFIYLSGQSSLPHWDLTPAGFLLSAVAIAWGAWRYQLLELQPVPRDTLVDASADGLIVLDALGRVVDLNAAAQQIAGPRAAIGQSVRVVLPDRPELLRPAAAPTRTEVLLGSPARVYDLSVTPLQNRPGELTGQLIALRDISAQKEAQAALREQKQLFENLVSVARATAERPSLEATLQNALNVAAGLTGAERGSLFLLNSVGVVTHSLLTFRGMTPDQQQGVVRRVMDRGLSGWVVRHRAAALISDTSQDDRWLASSSDAAPVAGSALGVPIISGAALVGVLTLTHAQLGRFTEEHLHLMQAAADQLALALRNAQIFEEQRLSARRQAALYGVMRAVGEQLNPQAVATEAVAAIVRLVNGEASWPGVGIALPGRDGQSWVLAAGGGSLAGHVGGQPLRDLEVIGQALLTGRTQTDMHVPSDPADARLVAPRRSELAVPLRRGTRVLGVLCLESDRPEAFDADDVQLAESLADAVALVLDNALLYQTIAGERSRLQALIEASRDGIFMLSMDLRLLVLNAPVLTLLGLPGTPADWLGRPLSGLLLDLRRRAPGLARAALAEVKRAAHGDEPAYEAEAEVPPRTVAWLSLPVLSDARPLGRLVVLRDVTEERDVQKLRDNLTHTMVHDLRNPLTNIRMALELLNQVGMAGPSGGAAGETQQREVLAIALNSTQRMLGLVNAILDVNRLESGQMPLVREPLPLHDVTTEVLLTQMPLALEKQLRLENQVPANLPVPSADGGLMRRVLQNLVGNAIKFTPAGGLVRVSGALDPGGEHVVVTVADTGPGLPPEIRANLFQKFVTGRHRERGSGLGLAYCRLAVEAHGGKIWAVSEPGWGAVFSFTLPFEADD
ncbi:MAG: GAF domain-containing protein [Anaerolineales bacterium]|nr:GAF domain-containing protein [Anaerolineales bacterium]